MQQVEKIPNKPKKANREGNIPARNWLDAEYEAIKKR